MPTVAILNPKGGSGKTTAATCLARGLEHAGQRVLLVDADPQGSARDWQAAAETNPTPVAAMDRPANLRNLPTTAADYDWTVIDGAGRLEEIIREALKIADLVLIPVQPSPYDVWAVSDLVELVKARQAVTDGQPVMGALITRAIYGTVLDREITDALAEMELEYLDARIHQRQVYARSANDGLTPLEMEPRGKAAEEIRTLVNEIRALFDPAGERAAV